MTTTYKEQEWLEALLYGKPLSPENYQRLKKHILAVLISRNYNISPDAFDDVLQEYLIKFLLSYKDKYDPTQSSLMTYFINGITFGTRYNYTKIKVFNERHLRIDDYNQEVSEFAKVVVDTIMEDTGESYDTIGDKVYEYIKDNPKYALLYDFTYAKPFVSERTYTTEQERKDDPSRLRYESHSERMTYQELCDKYDIPMSKVKNTIRAQRLNLIKHFKENLI